MSREEMEELLVFSFEVPQLEGLFEASPLSIAKKYLECFDSSGRQARHVPRFILEALARRLRPVLDGDIKTLDDAFGGRIRWQRNRLEESERQFRLCWAMNQAMEEIKEQPRKERGPGTPFEIAAERVAADFGMSADNVRRIYKAAGRKAAKKG